MNNIELAEDGTITTPDLHDGLLCGLLICAGKKVMLPVEQKNGVKLCLVMHGVERLRADDVREGNIILDVTVTTGDQLEMVHVAEAFGVSAEPSPFLQKTFERLKQNRMIAVRINPSYGCIATCICNELSVEANSLPL